MKNELLGKIQTRQSIRKFSSENIPESDLKEILKTGFSAPSAGNRQPWRVVVVKDDKRKEQLGIAAGGQLFITKAPINLVICAVPNESAERYKERGATLYALQDTAALTQNILLASHSMGYATCWIGAFNEAEVTKILSIPKEMRPVAIIPIGYSEGETPKVRTRRPFTEVIVEDKF